MLAAQGTIALTGRIFSSKAVRASINMATLRGSASEQDRQYELRLRWSLTSPDDGVCDQRT